MNLPENLCPVSRHNPSKSRAPALVMGTAQIGLDGYGIANAQKKMSDACAIDLLKEAFTHGINDLDCARAYGRAEERVGRALAQSSHAATVYTKLEPIAGTKPPDAGSISDFVENSVTKSLDALKLSTLPVLLLHQWADRYYAEGAVWNCLLGLQKKGLISRLGASLQNPAELAEALREPGIDHVQIPFNILDWRWEKAGSIDLLKKQNAVTVHVRSIYLQGLIFLPPNRWPRVDSKVARTISNRLNDFLLSFERESLADLALSGVATHSWIDGIVLGMENNKQLLDNLNLIKRPVLSPSQAELIGQSFMDVPADLLDPSTWPHE